MSVINTGNSISINYKYKTCSLFVVIIIMLTKLTSIHSFQRIQLNSISKITSLRKSMKIYHMNSPLHSKSSLKPDFKNEIDSKYFDYEKLEKSLYKWWEESDYFEPDSNPKKEKFVIAMPPPNVTGYLHMGHAMFVALQDLMTRFQRMRGKSTLWLPGTDHAGIATQLLVERELQKEGKTREELGRDAFLERVWEWKNEKGSYITQQMRRLGASTAWKYERFTLEPKMNEAVTEAFIQLYDKGLIYKGSYMVNWSPHLQTAVSDLEVEYFEEEGKLYYFKYLIFDENNSPDSFQGHINSVDTTQNSQNIQNSQNTQKVVNNNENKDLNNESTQQNSTEKPIYNYHINSNELLYIPIATTRPETILGDTAICVHPDDTRYNHLIGRQAIVPFTGRKIPIIADTYVDPIYGTGALKITPGHDVNDYELSVRHNLEVINIMNKNATINSNGGTYVGLDRFVCREQIWNDLNSNNLTLKIGMFSLFCYYFGFDFVSVCIYL